MHVLVKVTEHNTEDFCQPQLTERASLILKRYRKKAQRENKKFKQCLKKSYHFPLSSRPFHQQRMLLSFSLLLEIIKKAFWYDHTSIETLIQVKSMCPGSHFNKVLEPKASFNTSATVAISLGKPTVLLFENSSGPS